MEDGLETVNLKISGMTCQGCVRSVKNVLEGVRGVTTAEVSLQNSEARVVFDPLHASLGSLKAAVEEAGYEAA
jgi:copper chaperone